MNPTSLLFSIDSTNQAILPKLVALKALTLLAATLVAWLAYTFFSVEFHLPFFLGSLLAGYGVLCLCLFRLKLSFPVSEIEIITLLLTDSLVLFFLIGASGGGQNPFTSSLLIPLAVGVALVKKRYSALLLLAVIAMYAFWVFSDSFSGIQQGHTAHTAFSLHLYGMWINFLICAVLLFVFISYAMEAMRNREKQLQDAREKILNDEKLVAIATLTASTSHALGSPLSTMAILLEDAEQQGQLDVANIQLMQQQLGVCKQHLNHIAATARSLDTRAREEIAVTDLVYDLREHFNITRPTKALTVACEQNLATFTLAYNQSLFMALVNLVDNALQAATSETRVNVHQTENTVQIHVIDDGPGVRAELKDKLGQKFITTKAEGWGLGVYLANSTVEKFDGHIVMEDNPGGGTRTIITLPLLNI
ncbi:Globin-coupled histidine kinase [Thalassocella blandensis]|nr:Globin-coupled histidine kinase [Thalassocella blandensis]